MVDKPPTPLLSMVNISKSFPGTKALESVSFDVMPGEVHCLLGENGAGKSTLMKILAGSYTPDSGEIYLAGKKLTLSQPSDGIAAGIAVIYQELDLFPDLTVAQNIFLGHASARFGLLKRRGRKREAQTYLDRVGAKFPVDAIVRELPIADQQLTAIARALSMEAKLIVMDEPTATLGEGDVEKVFAVVRSLIAEGRSVVYISHRLGEVKEIGDTITVLRDGHNAAKYPVASTNPNQWIRDMIGEKQHELTSPADHEHPVGEVVLDVKRATIPRLIDVHNIHVRAGEIVGLAGLGGAGRTTLLSALYGSERAGLDVSVGGQRYRPRNVRAAVSSGMGLVPESRKTEGLFLGLSIYRNAGISSIFRAPWLAPRTLGRRLVDPVLGILGVKFSSGHQPVGELSGGNQQKVVLAKWLARGVRVLLLDEPTRGLDIGAKADLYRQVREVAAKGAAVLVASGELPELLANAHRVIVLHEGKNVAEFNPQTDSESTISHTIISGRVQ